MFFTSSDAANARGARSAEADPQSSPNPQESAREKDTLDAKRLVFEELVVRPKAIEFHFPNIVKDAWQT